MSVNPEVAEKFLFLTGILPRFWAESLVSGLRFADKLCAETSACLATKMA